MPITPATLRKITENILRKLIWLADGELSKMMVFKNYHGFEKARLPEAFLADVLRSHQVLPGDLQAEIVKVSTDLSGQIHFHKRTYAYVITLGQEVGLSDPKAALVFHNNRWRFVDRGESIPIPRRTAHGFSVDATQGGILYFLSVQAPPIVNDDGHDDYHQAPTTELDADKKTKETR